MSVEDWVSIREKAEAAGPHVRPHERLPPPFSWTALLPLGPPSLCSAPAAASQPAPRADWHPARPPPTAAPRRHQQPWRKARVCVSV